MQGAGKWGKRAGMPSRTHFPGVPAGSCERSRAAAACAAVLALVVGAGPFFLATWFPAVRAAPGDVGAAQARVRRGDFVRVVRLAGTTQAVHARGILAPRLAGANFGAMVLTSVAPAGTRVKKGAVLAEFDRQAQYKDYLQKQASYHDLASRLTVQRASEEAAKAGDDAALQQAKDAVQIAKLEVKKNPLVTRIQAEINNETLQENEATLKQLQHTYALKRQAGAAGIRNLAIQADRAKQTMINAEQNMQEMVLRSPMDGIAVLTEVFLNGTMGYVQVGSSIYPGTAFMRVVDPTEMEVSVSVNQADLPALRVGQQAVVHLEAYPSLSFSAVLEELSPLGSPGQYSPLVRTFQGVFVIRGSGPKLMPDLSAAVDVEVEREKNVLLVPIQSVSWSGGEAFVWLRAGDGFAKRQVRAGPENDLDVVIEAGLAPGDVIREYAMGSARGGAQGTE